MTATSAGVQAAELAERILSEPPAPLLELDPGDVATLDRIVTELVAKHNRGQR